MKHNNKVIYLLAAFVFLIGSGCKKYLDVNKNLNNPTVVPVSTLLTSAELSTGNGLGLGGGLTGGLSVYMHQQTTRGGADQYGMTGDAFNIENPWNTLYGALRNLDVIIDQGTTEGRLKYVGIAKILRAYIFSQIVDTWGDVPFSEFNKFKTGVLTPKFDDDATIYPQLFTLLDAGIADINNTAVNPTVPAADDVIYQGNTGRWVKAANTIKLKLYTQVRKVQNVTTQVTALLAAPTTLINTQAESFVMPYGILGTSSDDRNPGYSDYTASQRGINVSPWFYEMLKGYNTLHGTYPSPYAGIPDPRVPYYIYNQIPKATAMTRVADNQTEYRDTAFVTLYFGSIGPNRNGSQQSSVSLWGIYPVGGRYDDLLGGLAASASGTGAAPYKMITYPDRLYLQAELLNTGTTTTGVERTVFQNAITESMRQVDHIVTNFVKPTQTVPVLATQAATTAYIAAVMAKYDAASTDVKLQYIITEKWKTSFGSSVDQYTDYRRTGFPILFDPRDPAMAPGGFVQPPPLGNPFKIPQDKVQVARLNEFPLSLPWPKTELELNPNAPKQKPLPIVYKVFWMP